MRLRRPRGHDRVRFRSQSPPWRPAACPARHDQAVGIGTTSPRQTTRARSRARVARSPSACARAAVGRCAGTAAAPAPASAFATSHAWRPGSELSVSARAARGRRAGGVATRRDARDAFYTGFLAAMDRVGNPGSEEFLEFAAFEPTRRQANRLVEAQENDRSKQIFGLTVYEPRIRAHKRLVRKESYLEAYRAFRGRRRRGPFIAAGLSPRRRGPSLQTPRRTSASLSRARSPPSARSWCSAMAASGTPSIGTWWSPALAEMAGTPTSCTPPS